MFIAMCCCLIDPALADPETGMPQFIVDFMPNIFGGVLMAGIFAAIMSTTEALLLHSTSEISRNFLQQGILAGVLTGIPATAVWYYFLKPLTGIHEAYSVIVLLAAVIAVSLMTQKNEEAENWADKIRTMKPRREAEELGNAPAAASNATI